MNISNIIKLSAILLGVLLKANAFGFQVTSARIDYHCVGTDSFLITLNVMQDCSEIDSPDSVLIETTNSCFTGFSTYISQKTISYPAPYCARSKCNGGDLPGWRLITYTKVIVLNSSCSNWTLSYSNCCRDSTVNVIGNDELYVKTVIDFSSGNCNSSPVTYYLNGLGCINKTNYLDFRLIDPDGDILKYTFEEPHSSSDTSLTFQSGYNYLQPIPGSTIDLNSGMLIFSTNITGKYVFAIRISEYDPLNGNLIGYSIMDATIEVMDCFNSSPESINGITIITGNVTQISSDTVQVGYNESITFDIEFTDADTTDLITLFSNVEISLNGANGTISNGNPAHQFVSWISTNQDEIFTFSTTAADDQCLVGLNTEQFVIIIGDGINSVSQIDNSILELSVFPNPSISDNITLKFTLPSNGLVEIEIIDITGKVYFQTSTNGLKGINFLDIPVVELSKGIYNVKININPFTESVYFIR